LLEIEALVVKADLKTGIGQCIAEIVAVQGFNQARNQLILTIYGVISNGVQWQFLKVEDTVITIDLSIYPLLNLFSVCLFGCSRKDN